MTKVERQLDLFYFRFFVVLAMMRENASLNIFVAVMVFFMWRRQYICTLKFKIVNN